MYSPIRLACAALPILAAACDSPSGSNPPAGEAGVTIVSGANLADTVDALLPQPLIVQVTGANGRPLANAEVVFLSTAIAEGSQQPTVVVSPTRGTGGGTHAVEVTDAQGRAAVRVAMARTAMEGGVVVAVPAIDELVVAGYTILPGNAVTLAVLPADTAVRVGAGFALRASALDRHGNPRGAQGTTFRVLSGPVALAGAGAVAGTAVGRAAVVAELNAGADTAWVSVVPQGTIAAYAGVLVSNEQAALYTFELDGSDLVRRVTTGTFSGYNASMGSAWSPDGARLYYHDSNTDHSRSLHVLEMGTGASRRLLPEADRMAEEAWPRFGDGWVYFEGGEVQAPLLYRARPDGTAKEVVTPGAGVGKARHGAPSPDGTRVAFIGTHAAPMPLHVMDLPTGEIRSLGVTAVSPRWTRDGSEILYVASGDADYGGGPIRAIRPDGTGDRAVTLGATRFTPHFDLSPDGAYVVAASYDGVITLIDLAGGVEMPIRLPAVAQRMLAPAWRP